MLQNFVVLPGVTFCIRKTKSHCRIYFKFFCIHFHIETFVFFIFFTLNFGLFVWPEQSNTSLQIVGYYIYRILFLTCRFATFHFGLFLWPGHSNPSLQVVSLQLPDIRTYSFDLNSHQTWLIFLLCFNNLVAKDVH